MTRKSWLALALLNWLSPACSPGGGKPAGVGPASVGTTEAPNPSARGDANVPPLKDKSLDESAARPGFRCAVQALDGTSRPITRGKVELFAPGNAAPVAASVTDAEGIARFMGVAADDYTVRITAPDGQRLCEVGYEVAGDTPTPMVVLTNAGH